MKAYIPTPSTELPENEKVLFYFIILPSGRKEVAEFSNGKWYTSGDFQWLKPIEAHTKEEYDLLESKLNFFREQTYKLRDYLHEKKIGKPCQGFFDAILEHLKENEGKHTKEEVIARDIWRNAAKTP